MSRLYIFLLGGVALLISSVGAIFSIVGLTHLFAGAPVSVAIMAGSLEAAKLVTAGFLYRYWGHIGRLMRSYLSVAVVALSMITSLGVFGFLNHAYQKSSLGSKSQELRMAQIRGENEGLRKQIAEIEAFIASIPASRISKKFALYDESRAKVGELNRKVFENLQAIQKLEVQHLDTQAEIGPLADVAEMTGVKIDAIAKLLILLFVSVFDPLAICLVFAWGLAVRLREKYRGDEKRIGTLAFVKPVDHRFKEHRLKRGA